MTWQAAGPRSLNVCDASDRLRDDCEEISQKFDGAAAAVIFKQR